MGMLEPVLGLGKRISNFRVIAACASVCLAAACIVIATTAWDIGRQESQAADELLLKLHLAAHEPYSAPSNLYLWWGPETNHRFVGSGERIRQLLHMGNIEGGEWRDPMFLGNNGVETFESSRFRRISESCCATILIPPMEWEFPVFNVHNIIGQRIRNFVANGNVMVLTGGIPAIEFINSYFFFTMELADGNYSPGPFRRLPGVPKQMMEAPTVLPQKGISVTAVKKESLPSGTQVLWGTPRSSPVFMIKFCEAESPDEGMPPVKVLPRDCPMSQQAGRPCSCGHIMYIGYNYNEQYPSRWDKVLLASVEILSPTWHGAGMKAPESSVLQVAPAPAPAASAPAVQPQPAASQIKASDTAGQQALKAVTKESAVIQSLESALQTLDHAQERQATAAVHTSLQQEPLSTLEHRARQLVLEIDAAKDAGRRRHHRAYRRNRLSREDRLMQHSLITLSQDVAKIDGRVDKLAKTVQSSSEAAQPSAAVHASSSERRGRRGSVSATEAANSAAADSSNPAPAEPADASSKMKALERKLQKEHEEKEKLAKQAKAYQKELAYEQSMPTPEYSYSQPDHTTPMFGPGGVLLSSPEKSECGTMCKLKKLVQKTRARIDKELKAAMH